jgi:hypothetical protein
MRHVSTSVKTYSDTSFRSCLHGEKKDQPLNASAPKKSSRNELSPI